MAQIAAVSDPRLQIMGETDSARRNRILGSQAQYRDLQVVESKDSHTWNLWRSVSHKAASSRLMERELSLMKMCKMTWLNFF